MLVFVGGIILAVYLGLYIGWTYICSGVFFTPKFVNDEHPIKKVPMNLFFHFK